MDKVCKIICSILIALGAFLAGWLAHAWKNRDTVAKEVKKTITELNKMHKEALRALKEENKKQLKKKDRIISELEAIIDRLIKLLDNEPGPGVARLLDNLKMSKKELYRQ